ncbi:MAG: PglZ domain-containing protein [Nitrososphaeria archaeon]
MAGQLQEKIREIISDQLRDYPILVWYDEDASLQDIIYEAIPANVNFIPFEGSYLAIRAKIEKEDPEFERKWFIYIPKKPSEPSWIRDYELFGKKLEMNFEKLLTNYFGLESDLELKDLLKGERSRLLANKWEEVMHEAKPPIRKSQVINALLSAVFNLGASFSLGRAILEYVTFSTPKQELLKLELHDLFIKQVRSELNLNVEVDPENFQEALTSALLLSELVFYSKGVGKQKFGKLLPSDDKIETWANLAREWLEHSSLRQGFINWSEKLAKKYDIKSELYGRIDNLLNVFSFREVDEVLLEELKTRISTSREAFEKNLEVMEKIAEARKKSPWAIKEKINIWILISESAGLYKRCRESISLLEKNSFDSGFLANLYTQPEGLWEIDSTYRKIYSYVGNVEEEFFRIFLKPSFNLYSLWLRMFTERFSQAVETLAEWKIEGLLNQHAFWKEIVDRESKPLAIFFIDALRYELGKELEKLLKDKEYDVKLVPILSSIPSITELGMASLFPHESILAKVDNGRLKILLDETILVGTKETRDNILKDRLNDKAILIELSEVLRSSPSSLKTKIEKYDYIIISDRDIDIAGTYLLEISVNLFNDVVARLSEAVDKLHKTGIKSIVIITDHGFLLLPMDYIPNVVEGLKSDVDVDKKRRYIIGKPPYNPSLITFKFEQVWLKGEGIVAFPRGLSCLSVPGEKQIFLHGGISPQENIVSAIISKAKIEVGKIKVEAEIPDEITTAIFLINLIPLTTPEANKSRAVKIEVYSNERKIAESDTIELMQEPKKARIILKEIPSQAEVKVIDADTFELLKSKKVKISIVGYAEEI